MQKEKAFRLLMKELSNKVLLGEDGVHYLPFKEVENYLNLTFGVGFDEGNTNTPTIRTRRVVQILENNQEIIHPSVKRAAYSCEKGDPAHLVRCIKNNRAYKGYMWKYYN